MNEVTVEKNKINIRPLKATDIAPLTQIISKIGIKNIMSEFTDDEIKELSALAEQSGDESKADREMRTIFAGMNIITKVAGVIIEHYACCQGEIISFVAGVTGLTTSQIAELPLDEFTEVIVDIIKRPEFMGFMKVVRTLIK